MVEKSPDDLEKHPSFQERLDPGGEHKRLADGAGLLATGPVGWLMRKLGVEEDTLEAARNAPDRYAQLVNNIEDVANLLAPLGWIAFGAIPSDRYQEAAQLVADGDSEAAESVLTDAWEDRLDFALGPLLSLYADQTRRRIGHERGLLVREAIEGYKDGRYASAITLTLTQIDGIVYDMTGKDAKSFFASGRKATHLTDDKTIAGHPSGLVVLSALFTKDRKQTTLDGELRRHGIVHGRELGYDTKRNAIKTFVALFAVVEWAAPIDAAETERLELEREERYAGSDEMDEWGCRLDRRGFDSVQNALTTIQLYQNARFSRAGYASDVRELEANEEFSSIPDIEMVISADGRCFRVWAPTEGGIFFGVAGHDGEQIGWRYQGTTPPSADFLTDPEWRHLLKDEPHRDW
jgi:hypothetical protein